MSKSCSTLGLSGPFLDSISASVLACDKLSIGFGFSKANIRTILWSRKSHFSQWFGWCLPQTPAKGNEKFLRGISSKTNWLTRDEDVVWWQSSMSGEEQLLSTNSPHPVQDNSAVSCDKKALRHWKFPLEWKKGTIHEKYTVIRKDHCLHQNTGNKGPKQKVPVKRLRDGRWTSEASTPYESLHCKANNTQVEFPVNQSSQLPSTTSRHRASLAQDHKHVTSCLTQPPSLHRYHLATRGWEKGWQRALG